MMANLAGLIKNLILLLLLAGFFELVYPMEGLGRYIRLVIGLLIILSIIQPVLSLFAKTDQWHLTEEWKQSFYTSQGDVAAIISKGRDIEKSGIECMTDIYEKELESNMKELLAHKFAVDKLKIEHQPTEQRIIVKIWTERIYEGKEKTELRRQLKDLLSKTSFGKEKIDLHIYEF